VSLRHRFLEGRDGGYQKNRLKKQAKVEAQVRDVWNRLADEGEEGGENEEA
jgi:hypothetical protein